MGGARRERSKGTQVVRAAAGAPAADLHAVRQPTLVSVLAMRAMWIATQTARDFGLGNDFFDRKSTHVTPPGDSFLRNSEQLYGLWFFAINNYREWLERDQSIQIGEPDENGLRTFQDRASFGALRTTHYWLTAILATLIEAYSKDVLAFMALLDPEIHIASDTSSPSRESASTGAGAEDSTIRARRLSRRWFRRHKGPQRWIEGFEELGVTGFSPDLAPRLHELLGVRHLV
ncbi:MAG: hypothetical protein H0V43_01265 [Gemmatimonadales bacterium]|nr:hypothetical protein [Gemmatimonadales bacterium]